MSGKRLSPRARRQQELYDAEMERVRLAGVEFKPRPHTASMAVPAPGALAPPDNSLPLAVRFARFHAENPQVYERLVRLARRGRNAGARKLGIGQLFEVLRWQTLMATRDAFSDFKLNNDYRAPYARLIMEREPDLAGIFETRRSHVDEVTE